MAQHSIQLANDHVFSIPNYPNYRLGLGPPCDTSIVVSTQNIFIPPSEIKVYPNPASEVIHVSFNNSEFNKAELLLRDPLGAIILTKTISSNVSGTQLDIAQIPSGIYFLEVYLDHQDKHVEKIVIVK